MLGCTTVKAQLPQHFIAAEFVVKDSLSVVKIKQNKIDEIIRLRPLNLSKNIYNYILNRYGGRADYLTYSIENGDFLIGSPEEAYVRRIVQVILKANPEIRQDMLIFVSRSDQPNAFNLGDGTIVVNLGLLNYIENEAQLAFILCHELAHQYRLHVDKDIQAKAVKYMDKDFRRKLKRVLHQEYKVKSQLTDLLLPGVLNDMQYSRSDETEADSIGLVFLSKTGYDVQQSLTSMDMLDHVDEEIWKDTLNLLKFFTFPDVPARSDWFYYQGSSLGNFEEVKDSSADSLADSLKTHPDCMMRKSKLESQIKRSSLPSGKLYVLPEDTFKLIKMFAEGETIQSYYFFADIGRTMYLSLRMLEKYPGNVYPRAMESKCLAIFSYLQKNRHVGEYVALPSDDHSENYNRFLSFLMELRINESAKMSYNMVFPESAELKKYDEYLAALTCSAYVNNNDDNFIKLKEEYLKNFTNGNTREFIKELTITPTTKKSK